MSDFDEAVTALCRDVLGGPAVESGTLQVVRRGLIRQLRVSYPTLVALIEDLADEAICRLVEQTAAGVIQLEGHPGGYLRVSANRLALQWLRRAAVRRRLVGTDEGGEIDHGSEDDPIAELVGRLSDIADAHRALDAAMDARDHHATKALQAYIDHASQSEDWPLLSEVAADAGVSHPTMRAVLRYTGTFLSEGHERWQRVHR
jgi:DNA-directed RNA polymerase specialized sigma24 family protein